MPPTPEECAALFFETVPVVMRSYRRGVVHGSLTLPQMGALRIVGFSEGISMSDLAQKLGLGVPATSKLVQGLVAKDLLVREAAADDRRRVELRVGPEAKKRWKAFQAKARGDLATRLEALTADERTQLAAGLRGVARVLGSGSAPIPSDTRGTSAPARSRRRP